MARKTKKLQQRNKFIILTNGRESEKNYFEALRGFRRSIYDVRVEFENAAPPRLVNRAIREKETSNQVWVVFDKDEFPADAIYEAMKSARQNNVGVAFSNAAFEVWLINHFKEFSSEKSAGDLLPILDLLLKNNGYSKGYAKNDADVFHGMLLPLIDTAMHNADISLQKRIAAYNQTHPGERSYPYCEWNSCTTVHKLVEALKLE